MSLKRSRAALESPVESGEDIVQMTTIPAHQPFKSLIIHFNAICPGAVALNLDAWKQCWTTKCSWLHEDPQLSESLISAMNEIAVEPCLTDFVILKMFIHVFLKTIKSTESLAANNIISKLHQVFAELHAGLSCGLKEVRLLIALKDECYEDIKREKETDMKLGLIEGARQLINESKSVGWKICVVHFGDRARFHVDMKASGLAKLPNAAVNASVLATLENVHDIYREAVHRLHMPIDQCLVVCDHPREVLDAHALGLTALLTGAWVEHVAFAGPLLQLPNERLKSESWILALKQLMTQSKLLRSPIRTVPQANMKGWGIFSEDQVMYPCQLIARIATNSEHTVAKAVCTSSDFAERKRFKLAQKQLIEQAQKQRAAQSKFELWRVRYDGFNNEEELPSHRIMLQSSTAS